MLILPVISINLARIEGWGAVAGTSLHHHGNNGQFW